MNTYLAISHYPTIPSPVMVKNFQHLPCFDHGPHLKGIHLQSHLEWTYVVSWTITNKKRFSEAEAFLLLGGILFNASIMFKQMSGGEYSKLFSLCVGIGLALFFMFFTICEPSTCRQMKEAM